MDHPNGDPTPADLASLAARLRDERPTASALELDEIKRRALRQSARTTPRLRLKGQLMKSRLALTVMIVLGLMTSGTGATLAITGSSGSGSAAQQQYDTVQPQENGGQPETLGDQDAGGPPATQPAAQEEQPVEETQQVAAAGDSSDSLPFTGFFTIPLIVGGVALLSTGVFLRRRLD